ncbi:methyl-accepting chemotaxis protein [Xylophilus sp.]|uniref:methyl-accepting chemotaxis protein n=1 Tax=Xylophilus sp. TaxID=2653893 RepID=UPI0013BDAF2A|nr:PAS domain-containing methyl-accepting chemotaxis protein [Xylophilus sp.]KAF1048101.1 MAG: Aerotaxis receptor [Xylophilus sp.]
MRTNLPVTQREHALSPDDTFVSVTDLQGRITYCNPAFVQVSGFTRDELLGQPHNIVRHPDMPAEAFRDLWETLQQGLPWTGLVKNRRKDGDHYWVRANATPMRDGEQVVGYLSVRTAPDRQAVQDAEALYAAIREEAAAGRIRHQLRQGVAVRRGPAARAARLFTPASRLFLVQLAAAGLAAVPAFCGWWHLAAGAALAAAGLAFTAVRRAALLPLLRLTEDANRLAAGDLSHPVATGAAGPAGRLQQALAQMSVNLRTVVRDVRHEVRSLETAVAEISSGNHDLSSRTEAQAGSLQQTAASMEQIHGTVRNSADSARRGAELAHETSAVTQRSNEAVQAVGESMAGIAESSRRIEDIIRLIEGVAFQTNILALNAAVEAARAGEAGRGFAVVAAEVRTLAQKTTAAAGEVKALIAESSQRVASGACTTGQARERMAEALGAVGRMRGVLDEISTAAAEQQDGIAQVNAAVAHLDGITQQNAAMVEQLAAAASSVHGQVQGVRDTMRLFRLARGEPSLAQADAVALRRAGREPAPAPRPLLLP